MTSAGARAALAAMLTFAACGDNAAPTVIAIFEPAALHSDDPADFYDLPFPTDMRRGTDSRIDLTGYPAQSPVIASYATAIEAGLDGFGLNAGIYLRLSAPIDTTTLPSPEASKLADASVYLVDVDQASPGYGARTPIRVHFTPTGYDSAAGNLLAVLPFPGFPLRQATTYALVVTNRVHAVDGTPVGDAPQWADVRAGKPGYDAEAATYAPLWAWLDSSGSDDVGDVVVATVFTTQHATDLVPRLRQAIWQLPAPTASELVRITELGTSTRFYGSYDAPNFQRGTLPYKNSGGDITVDAAGLPVVQNFEHLRFALTIPDGPTPATGWPIVLYEHGTGGDYRSFISDGTAEEMARRGMAAISMDQLMHGPRNPGGDPELDFFNFINPLTARDNVAQGAADGFSLTRLATGLRFHSGGREIFIDPARVYFFGHSQGSTTGAPFIAYEPDVKGAVFSGAGGVLYLTLINKTEPVDIPSLVLTLARDEPLDDWNPTLALLQTWAERADSVNYAPLLVREPPLQPGADGGLGDGSAQAPKAIFQTDGIDDHYAPNVNGRAFFVGIGGDLVGPELVPLEGLALRGRTTQTAPMAGNLNGNTAALLQYQGGEGHFVVFDVPAATKQAAEFLATHAATGTATVVVP